MTAFPFHDIDDAPAESRELLEAARRKYGMVPNLFRGLAEAPAALAAYFDLASRLAESGLGPKEQQVLFLAASHENACDFCMAAHSFGGSSAGLPEDTLRALREGRDPAEKRYAALARFTRAVVRERGRPGDAALQAFLDAGFSKANVLEVVLGVSMKTLSNDANHLMDTPLNEELAQFAWEPAGVAH